MNQLPAATTSVVLGAIPSLVTICQSLGQAELTAAIISGGAAIFHEVWTEVRASNPDAKATKVDPEMALAIAQSAVLKTPEVQKIWKELLRTAIDSERSLTVTKDDIGLLNGMDPYQVLLVDTLFRNGDSIHDATCRTPAFGDINFHEKNSLTGLASFKVIQERINFDHGKFPSIGIEDFCYMIDSRAQYGAKEQDRTPLFHCEGYQLERAWNKSGNGTHLLNSDCTTRITVDSVFAIRLSQAAIRLAKKVAPIP